MEGLVPASAFLLLLKGMGRSEEMRMELKLRVRELEAEVRRLRRGELTPDEFQALCHHLDERPGCTRADFEAGCKQYQDDLFGPNGAHEGC